MGKRFTVALADRHEHQREPASRAPKVLLYSHDIAERFDGDRLIGDLCPLRRVA